jgi:hypothetical protein
MKSAELTGASGTNSKVFLIPPPLTESTRPIRLKSIWPQLGQGRIRSVTAKEKLLRDVLELDEAKAARARIVVVEEPEHEAETVPLPEGWGRMANGEPMPDVAAAVRRSREGH